jgi:hypothetical protein
MFKLETADTERKRKRTGTNGKNEEGFSGDLLAPKRSSSKTKNWPGRAEILRTNGLGGSDRRVTRPDRRVTKNKRQKNTHARNQALGRGPKAEQQNHEAGGSSS